MKQRMQRGFTTIMVLSVVAGVTLLIVIGLDRRAADVDIDGRTLCRAAARAAAESAIARGEAQLARAGAASALKGTLPAQRKLEVGYRLEVGRDGAAVILKAEGTCAMRDAPKPINHRIEVREERDGPKWQVKSWREP